MILYFQKLAGTFSQPIGNSRNIGSDFLGKDAGNSLEKSREDE